METMALVAWVPLTYHTLEVDLRELHYSLDRRAHLTTSTPSLSQLATYNTNIAMVSGPPYTSVNIYIT